MPPELKQNSKKSDTHSKHPNNPIPTIRPAQYPPKELSTISQRQIASAKEISNPANDSDLSIMNSAKNFAIGFAKPVTGLFQNKQALITSAVAITGAILLTAAAPEIAVALTAAGLVYGSYLIVKGGVKIVSHLREGKTKQAEKDFETLGEGVGTTALASLGVRSSLQVAGIKNTSNGMVSGMALVVKNSVSSVRQTANAIYSGEAKRNFIATTATLGQFLRASVFVTPSEDSILGLGLSLKAARPEVPSKTAKLKKLVGHSIEQFRKGFLDAPPVPEGLSSQLAPSRLVNPTGASQGLNELRHVVTGDNADQQK